MNTYFKEPSKPDFDMIKQIYDKDKFCPENKGFLTGEEAKYLSSTLELGNRTILSLRNLRNFVVSYHYGKLVTDKDSDQDAYKMSDLLSAITGVIDSKIFELGGMV